MYLDNGKYSLDPLTVFMSLLYGRQLDLSRSLLCQRAWIDVIERSQLEFFSSFYIGTLLALVLVRMCPILIYSMDPAGMRLVGLVRYDSRGNIPA